MNLNLLQIILFGISFSSALGALILILKESIKRSKAKHKKEVPEYQSIVAEANREASNLLNTATRSAEHILRDTHKTNENIEQDLDHVLSSIAAKDIHSIEQTLSHFEKSHKEQLENLTQRLEKTALDAIQNAEKNYVDKLSTFSQELLKNGLSTQTMVDKKIAELVSVADEEVNEYKKKRMEKIDQEVKELLERVYRQVLKTSIPESLQHDLILKNLDEAKKDGIFNL